MVSSPSVRTDQRDKSLIYERSACVDSLACLYLQLLSSYANVIAAKTESLMVPADGIMKKQYASLTGWGRLPEETLSY